jgi:thioredoxin-like negative regulator of GroEL
VIQAGASWCGPCQILKPKLLDAVKAEKGKVEFLYIDVDAHQGIAQMLQVSSNYQKALT